MLSRKLIIGGWAIAVGIALTIVLRAHYTADLSAFLPRAPSAAQELLVEQLREGPASRLILVSIEGSDAASRARASSGLAEQLSTDPNFRTVSNGASLTDATDQTFVFDNRYVLSDRINDGFFEPARLRAVIQANLDTLASSIGLIAKDLLPRDPTGETLQVVLQMTRSHQPAMSDGVWVSPQGERALLVAETVASGSDTDGQKRAIDRLRSAFAALPPEPAIEARARPTMRLTGPAVFSVDARERIQSEAMRLSLVSSALIAAFLLAVYRSIPALVLGMLPVAIGGLAGVGAVSLGFGVVHGVTLGFGVTLIGESVDYSIYLFIQGQHRHGLGRDHGEWTAAFWPTIRLGMLTSVVGFVTLLPSSFPGLAQLGCYSIAGLVVAALVTRFLMPVLLPAKLKLGDVAPVGRVFSAIIAKARPFRGVLLIIPVLACVALWTQRASLWNTELSSLSPVSKRDQDFDASVRADLSAPDVRTIVVASGDTDEEALIAAESASQSLLPLVQRGVIAGFDAPTRYLSSRHAQGLRRRSLPPPGQLRDAFHEAVAPLAIREEMFAGFFDDVEASRSRPDVGRRDMQGLRLASAVDALLSHHGDRWHALLPLEAPRSAGGATTIDSKAVSQALSTGDDHACDCVVLDLKQEANSLYGGYLRESIRLSLAGLAAILVLLALTLRSAARVLRVVVPLVLSVLVVVTVFALAGHQMTILNLVGLLLIVAVGSNYALFFDRQMDARDSSQYERTVASLLVANVTTVTGFGVLAFSSVPVLSAVGSTVAPGAFLALVFSALLAEPPSKPSKPSAAV